MNNVEARVRTTLRAVAEATATDGGMASYVESSPAHRSRRPLALLATAAATLLVVGAAVTLRPGSSPRRDTTPAAATTPTTVSGPEGGRLVAEGAVGAERWALYGADRLPSASEPPNLNEPNVHASRCFELVVSGREHTARGCGFEPGAPGRSAFWQLGPAVESNAEVLVLGVLDAAVREVTVEYRTTKRQVTVTALPDPAYPDGARYLVAVVPQSEGEVQLRFHGADGNVLGVSDVQVDGPVGG